MSNAMNDEEVITELKKMVAFIRQEAVEKAREIQVKADEEFAIEKAKIVRQESMNLDTQFDKKKKQVEVSQKIAKSNQNNKARLEVLKSREENLQNLFSAAQEQLATLSKDGKAYKELLSKLLLECLLNLHEPTVEVLARSTDVQNVQSVVKDAVKQYKEMTGRETEVDVKEGLSKDSAGGLILTAQQGRIRLDNTLEQRLKLLEEQMLPELRLDLFGPNKNRKFFT
ncbi:V-ATPase V1 sector subunit E [Malassezia pachydermatis]|uniref:Atpase v1 a1 complex subunit e n=1 Tax=Malassezia pachydermatis TaxID=77020 RepID=A0A0N0RSK5_9BASI|nr:atpase v1 a1 complex subunit e [Malassezia pachydermatis]KOS15453.1 atpase v1 a1 complex subunit e [Malassezia pachydermatis]